MVAAEEDVSPEGFIAGMGKFLDIPSHAGSQRRRERKMVRGEVNRDGGIGFRFHGVQVLIRPSLGHDIFFRSFWCYFSIVS